VREVAHERTNAKMTDVEFIVGEDKDAGVLPTNEMMEIYMPGIETPLTFGKGGTTFDFEAVNDQGQGISAGAYYIKIEQVDAYGHADVFIKNLTVIEVEKYVELRVFNNAGEIVRTIRDYNADTANQLKMNVEPSYLISKDTGGQIDVFYNDNGNYIMWDGKNESGYAVSSGTYELQVIVKTEQNDVVQASKRVVIMYEPKEFLSGARVYPNPFISAGAQEAVIEWNFTGSIETGSISIAIYNIAGELVKKLRVPLEDESVKWDGRNTGGETVAHGYYIIVMEGVNSEGHVNRLKLKMAVMGDMTDTLENP